MPSQAMRKLKQDIENALGDMLGEGVPPGAVCSYVLLDDVLDGNNTELLKALDTRDLRLDRADIKSGGRLYAVYQAAYYQLAEFLSNRMKAYENFSRAGST